MNTHPIKRVGKPLAFACVLLLAAPDASAGIFYGEGYKGGGGMNGTIARAAGTIGSTSKSIHSATMHYHGVHRGSGNNQTNQKASKKTSASTYTAPTYSLGYKLVYNQAKHQAKMERLQGEISQMEKSPNQDLKSRVQLLEAKRDFLFHWGKVLKADASRIGWAAKKSHKGDKTEQWRNKKVTREQKELHLLETALWQKAWETDAGRNFQDSTFHWHQIAPKHLSKTMVTMIDKQYKQATTYIAIRGDKMKQPAKHGQTPRELIRHMGATIAPVADGYGERKKTVSDAITGMRVMSSQESAAWLDGLLKL